MKNVFLVLTANEEIKKGEFVSTDQYGFACKAIPELTTEEQKELEERMKQWFGLFEIRV